MDELLDLAQAIVKKKQGGAELEDLDALLNQGLSHILSIKLNHRDLVAEVETEKSGSAKQQAKARSEELDVLRAELAHHQNEERMTRDFKAIQEEDLGIMPQEAFIAGNPNARNLGAHELMKARLLHEHRQRKALVAELQEQRAHERLLSKQVEVQQAQMEDLQGKMQQLQEQTRPLQAVLSPVAPLHGCMDKHAYLLPAPLYLVYSQLVSACEALHEPCTAVIKGDLGEARAALQASISGASSKAAGKGSGLSGEQRQQWLSSLPEAEIYQPHPLSVCLSILPIDQGQDPTPDSRQPLLCIIFQYLPALEVVTACCHPEAAAPSLAALFPGDDGSGACIEALAQLQGGSFRFSPSHVPRPYMWCQRLAGLDLVAPLPQADPLAHSNLGDKQHQQLVVSVIQGARSLVQGS